MPRIQMLNIKNLFIIVPLVVFMQCREKAASDQTSGTTQPSELDNSAVSGLYTHYVQNPQLQAHKDENLIIDHIVSTGEDFQRHETGFYYLIMSEGKGDKYSWSAPCTTHYRGYFLNGDVFDSSYAKDKPISFRIGQMIQAWNIILQEVSPGAKLKIIVPSRLAYGTSGFPGYVPPNTVIAFDIETLAAG